MPHGVVLRAVLSLGMAVLGASYQQAAGFDMPTAGTLPAPGGGAMPLAAAAPAGGGGGVSGPSGPPADTGEASMPDFASSALLTGAVAKHTCTDVDKTDPSVLTTSAVSSRSRLGTRTPF